MQPITDDYILRAVEEAGGLGNHDPSGHYAEMVMRDLKDREEAEQYSKSLYRCALWLHRHGIPVSLSKAKIEPDGKRGFKITYRISDKTMARKYHLETRGTDRSKWPYDPRRKGNG
jgi:hypothetical protein